MQKEPDGGWMLTSDNEEFEPIGTGIDFTVIGEIVWRGTWLGEKMVSKKHISDMLRLFEIMAQNRVDKGEAASFDEAIAAIEAEMAADGVFDDDR